MTVICRVFTLIVTVFALVFTNIASYAVAAGNSRPTIGLALSGGGAKGLAHIGVLKVLAEAGIRPDYIAGTSMGAIVGGLAAIGYSATDLDTLVLNLDWRTIINDEISLRNLSLEEKSEARKYAASFPIRDNQVGLPTGLIAGHRLSVLLSHLTLPVHDTATFDDFPIPFRCVATDVETGEAVVFDRGFLADAIRASASIPTIFTPYPYNGRTFVDGFLVRNLPATDVRDMGADIVIGVDVGALLYTQDELNSLVRIMMQTISFRSSDVNSDQQDACDILIMPAVEDIDNLSFDNPADIIARGEMAARAQFDKLKALADSLNTMYGPPAPLSLPAEIDTLTIQHIDIEGLSEVSDELFRTKLNITTPSRITPHQLERALNRAYGSQYFDRVTYRYTQTPRPNTLVIRVTERDVHYFRFGLHYDSVLKSSLLLNTTFRNIGGQGSRVLLSGRFGESPVYEASYFIPTTSRPSMGLELRVRYQNMEVITYSSDGKSEASLDYSSLDTTLLFKSIFSNAFSVGAAIEYHYSKIRTKIAPEMYSPWDYGQVNLHGYIELDTLDRAVYPRAGYQLYLGVKRITDTFSAGFLFGDQTFDSYIVKYLEIFQVLPRVSVFGSFNGGMLSTDVALPDYYFFLGGLRTAPGVHNMFPFAGLKTFQREGVAAFVHTMGFQYEFATDWFIIGQVNQGKVSMDRSEIISRSDILRGAALSVGRLTAIGPFEYSLMWCDKREGMLTNINIGFLF